MKETRIPKIALQWTPQGRHKKGRPAVTSSAHLKGNDMGTSKGKTNFLLKNCLQSDLESLAESCWTWIMEANGSKI
ncbi:hypothetical protein BpHYR1_049935 [Brachionus plicatilis]|uniref:Uncharacterized protein n=1 Tax=Brachionus plicatilis TaxID=10195 RepID=A0A3M7RWG4_BRAPC|nr:hypothetical protein BpHYR1_049935 [Brachionus plicatilis]